MLNDFYEVAASASFTLLGLWWVVVAARKTAWQESPGHRRAAFAISLQFALPGVMTLVSLVDPTNGVLWRLSFGIAATIGAVGLILLQGGATAMFRRPAALRASYAVAFVLYVCIALVALLADVLKDSGAEPQQLDAALVAIVFFVGVCIAWLLFDE
jgi:hypothetical protein